ncbi:MAG: HEPN domain-containing protein [Ruminococcus sp.]|nr:HEPN domain-containing protein [Ruminococcus sp.]MCC8174077.1 HEPN domain-containing protein [Odoribacter sp.]
MVKTRQEIIQHLILQADDDIALAQTLMGPDDTWITVDRLYFACYHAAKAFLFSKGITVQTDNEVYDKFIKIAIAFGKIDKTLSEHYNRLLTVHLSENQPTLLEPTYEEAQQAQETTKAFVEKVKSLLAQKDKLTK